MTHYRANLTAGALMLPASRRIAALLLTQPTPARWSHAIRIENILQKDTPATAVRLASLIRARLVTLPCQAWPLVAQSAQEPATQTLLVAALRHSALLQDFFTSVLAGHHRRLETVLSRREWEPYLADCAAREPQVGNWTPATRAKLWEVVVRILVEARYVDSPRALNLRVPNLHPQVRRLLQDMGDLNVIRTMELQP